MVSGGLRPLSDIDLLAVVDGPIGDPERKALLDALLQASGHYPAPEGAPRPIELTVFDSTQLRGLGQPPRAEFLYGEWLRSAFEAGDIPEPFTSPDLALILAQARLTADPIAGPAAVDLLPVVSPESVRSAMLDALPALIDDLDGDERNVLLTLARMWRTAERGDFVSKDAAATWCIPLLPEATAATLARASDAYLTGNDPDWRNRRAEVHEAAIVLRERAVAALATD